MTERWEEQLEQALHAAHPETTPSAGWEPRARAAMTQVRPARPRRLIAVTALTLMGLVGLSFVPIPLGRVSGSLDRALAAMEQLTTRHVVSWHITPEGTEERESWYSADGFFREETRLDGILTEVRVADGPRVKQWAYLDGDHTRATVWESFSPMRWRDPTFISSDLGAEYEKYRRACEYMLTNMVTEERRQYRAWSGAVDVVALEATVKEPGTLWGVFSLAPRGDRVRLVAEVEAASNRLLSLKEYCFRDGWQLVSEEYDEWDVQIPEELHEFSAPEGAELLPGGDWWESRVTQIVAQDETPDWRVVIQGVDVNENGDVFLSLLLERKPDRAPHSGGPPLVEAYDSAGVTYEQERSRWGAEVSGKGFGYWVTRLYRDPQATARASAITFTIFPYPGEEGAGESVTLTVPLPERQEGDDLPAR